MLNHLSVYNSVVFLVFPDFRTFQKPAQAVRLVFRNSTSRGRVSDSG